MKVCAFEWGWWLDPPIFPAVALLRLSPARAEANDKLPHHVALDASGIPVERYMGAEVLG